METNANWESIQGHWNDYKGRVKEKWGKLTEDDLEQIEGRRDRLIGALQQRYGATKDKAEEQVNSFIASAGSWLQEARDKVVDAAEKSKQYLQETSVKDMAKDMGDLVARYPVYSALIGIGVGYLVGRLFTSSNRS